MGRHSRPKRSRIADRNPLRIGSAFRATAVALLAVVGGICLALWSTMATAMKLVAATVLIMGGTNHPLGVPPDTQTFVNNYVAGAQNNYLGPGGFCPVSGCGTVVAVITPEQFAPIYGSTTFDQSVAQGLSNLDACVSGSANCVTNPAVPGTSSPPYAGPFVIFGYSQSATVATLEKAKLAAEPNPPAASFFLLENPNRPDGGILARAPGVTIPILGVTFSGPTPTDTPFPTIDVARQYDGVADAPLNPLNLLADVNAVLGYVELHGSAPGLSLSDAQFQGQYGDTSYYLIPTPVLPLLMPLGQLGVPAPILAALDAPLRVLVEAGYNRTISPGQPTPFNLLYFPNPIALAVNLVVSIPTGIDNGLAELGLGRPLGTQVPGPYGVGGPPVDPPGPPGPAPAPLTSTLTSTSSIAAVSTTASPVSLSSVTTNANAPTADTTPSPQVAKTTSSPPSPAVTPPSQPAIVEQNVSSTAPLTGSTTKPSPTTTAATGSTTPSTSATSTSSTSTSSTAGTSTSTAGTSTGTASNSATTSSSGSSSSSTSSSGSSSSSTSSSGSSKSPK